jgi:hypothetical protein
MYTNLSSSGSQKKIGHELIYFFFAAVTANLQFSNFKAPVIASSLVAILFVLEGSILVKSTKVESLLFRFERPPCYFRFDICHPCTWATRVTPQ